MVRLRQHPNGIWYIHYDRTNRKSLETKDAALAQRLFAIYAHLSAAHLEEAAGRL